MFRILLLFWFASSGASYAQGSVNENLARVCGGACERYSDYVSNERNRILLEALSNPAPHGQTFRAYQAMREGEMADQWSGLSGFDLQRVKQEFNELLPAEYERVVSDFRGRVNSLYFWSIEVVDIGTYDFDSNTHRLMYRSQNSFGGLSVAPRQCHVAGYPVANCNPANGDYSKSSVWMSEDFARELHDLPGFFKEAGSPLKVAVVVWYISEPQVLSFLVDGSAAAPSQMVTVTDLIFFNRDDHTEALHYQYEQNFE